MRIGSLPGMTLTVSGGLLALPFGWSQIGSAPTGSASSPPMVLMQDGGTSEVLEGIEIPPIAKAPFSSMLETEWVRPLAEGGTWTTANRRRIARDSAGRVYQERWLLAPKGGKARSRMSHIQIADPVKHTAMTCSARSHTCTKRWYSERAEMVYKPSPEQSGPLANGAGAYAHDRLGEDTISGLPTIGMRDTTTLNPGIVGNDRPVAIVREFWFSPKLGINLVSSLSDGRYGVQRFKVTELSEGEPDATLFELPKGYAMVEQQSVTGSPE